jgi:hypothetical protein
MERRIKRAATCAGAGLLLQLAAALHWTPLTFVLSAVLATPLVLLGGFLFLHAIWRNMSEKGAI